MGSTTEEPPSRLPYLIAAVGAIALVIAGAVWILQRGDELATLRGHTGVVRAVLFAPDGTLISAGDDGTIRTWNTSSNSLRKTMQSHSGKVTAIAVVPKSQMLVSAGDDGV